MRRPVKKSSKKIQKNNFEERFSAMVKEYQQAKETLESLIEGSPEYIKQKKVCDKLFSSAEQYLNRNQQLNMIPLYIALCSATNISTLLNSTNH